MFKLLLLFLSFSVALRVSAQRLPAIELTNLNLDQSHGQNADVLRCEKGHFLDFESVRLLSDSAFHQGTDPILDFNFTTAQFWLRFELHNQSDFTHFIVELGRTVTNRVEFYELTNDSLSLHFISGDDFDYEDKEIAHRKNIFPIELEKGEMKTYFVCLESDGELLFSPILVHERMAFFAQDFKDQFKNGFYYGLILLVVVIYFFFYLFLKDRTYLFYILYAFSQGVLQFSLDGYSHHHFFPRGGYWTNHILLFFAGLTVIFLLTYVAVFLQVKERSKRLWKVFYISRAIMAAIVLLSLVPGISYEISYPIINGASLFSILLAAFAIIRLRIKGFPVDFFFALAFIILIIGGVVFILGNLSIVGDKLISLGALKISSALEFVVLSISMSKKYGELQDQKEEAQRFAFQNLEDKNALIDQQNVLLEKQVKERTFEIENQKEELAKSKEEIVASIKYAQRIQRAILPSDDHIREQLPNSYVFYRPKDVVSGDFYFVEKTVTTNSEVPYVIFAAVDCTGHGVPGAFMSIVGNNLLTQSLTESSVNTPAQALDFLNAGVNKTLRRTIEGVAIRDGMDIAICAINLEKKHLMYAGAKNPLYIIRQKKELMGVLSSEMEILEETDAAVLIQIKGDRHPVGNAFEDELKPFTNHSIALEESDQVYVFTDGFADQFGGSGGKKYNYKRFRNFILSICHLSGQEQRMRFGEEFDEWLGETEQIDDVLIIRVAL